jgi:hypothetical protein
MPNTTLPSGMGIIGLANVSCSSFSHALRTLLISVFKSAIAFSFASWLLQYNLYKRFSAGVQEEICGGD